jgi:hypothetical protein
MPNMRKIDLETPVVEPITVPKAKREITEAQRDHLNKIRELAMKKKAELKEITLKSKLAKTVPKQELAKKYDEYIAQKAVTTQKPTVTNQPKPEEEEESEEEETVIVKKPKKKIKKKIIFESESEDEETVVVQKKKPPPQKQPLEKLVYESNKDQLYQRMIEERVKNAVIGYGRALNGF